MISLDLTKSSEVEKAGDLPNSVRDTIYRKCILYGGSSYDVTINQSNWSVLTAK